MESTNGCKQINELLDAFHDGELRGEEHAQVERHLKECESCVVKLAEIDHVTVMLKTAPLMAPPIGFSDRLDSVIDRQTNVVPMRRRTAWAAGAVAAVAVIAAGLHFVPGSAPPPPAPTIANAPSQAAPNATRTDQRETQIATLPSVTSSIPKQTATVTTPAIAAATATTTPSLAPSKASSAFVHKTHAAPKSISTTDGATSIATATSHGASFPHSQYDSSPSASASAPAPSPASEQIADLPVTTNSFNEAVGLSTDEDGLYDIKM